MSRLHCLLALGTLAGVASCSPKPPPPLADRVAHAVERLKVPDITEAITLIEGAELRGDPAACVTLAVGAMAAGRFELVQQMEELHLDYKGLDGKGRSVLQEAILRCEPDQVATLLRFGCDPKLPNAESTALGFAAGRGSPGMVSLLAGVLGPTAVDTADRHGQTPIQLACFSIRGDPTTTVTRLLELGADPLRRDRDGSCALDIAAMRRDPACLSALLATGCDPDAGRDPSTRSPLVVAIESGNVECVRALLARGAKATVKEGAPPLSATVPGSTDPGYVQGPAARLSDVPEADRREMMRLLDEAAARQSRRGA